MITGKRELVRNLIGGWLLGLLAGTPSLADDTEVFVGNIGGSEASRPNVLFILDTSRSMQTAVAGTDPSRDRLQVLQEVTTELLDTISNVNVGVMRLSSNNEGGMILHPIENIGTSRSAVQEVINGLNTNVPIEFGFTPISETLYEAGLYFLGARASFGLTSTGNPDGAGGVLAQPSAAAALTGPTSEDYLQPAVDSVCRKNFIVLLSDGRPTKDAQANELVSALPDFEVLTGNASCDITADDDTEVDANGDPVTPDLFESGICLDDMAAYLFNSDLDQQTEGVQNVVTYTIAAGTDARATRILERAATRGGGESFLVEAFDPDELREAFSTILTEVREKNTTFTSPAVAVNAFNRTQNLDDLYFAVFKAGGQPHWDGNLKKYRLVGGEIVGVDPNVSAVDPDTGYFSETAQSFWSPQVDGIEAAEGGAASQLPGPVTRSLYTYTGSSQLTAASNSFIEENVSAEMLGIDPLDADLRSAIISWSRGQDVLDEDDDGNTVEARMVIGDPLHSTPAVVVYGGLPSSPDVTDAVVYFGTNDGFLHAIDATSGIEEFAFIPAELLKNLSRAYEAARNEADNPDSTSIVKAYGLDGAIQVLREDVNGDGIITPGDGDRVVLYFGMRRGEDVNGDSYYYAIDVSDRNDPRQLWVLGPGQLPDLGQTWSTPVVTRVDIDGVAQNSNSTVLVFSGGYSESQDTLAYSTDDVGNAVYMVDAETGNLLWSAGDSAPHDLVIESMNNSIPANVRVLDLNNDTFADRMYVGDMGGRIWRFDVFNGQAPSQLVSGGVIASLGAADLEAPTAADNRRFYNAPDIAFVPAKTGAYLNIAIGSGYRAHPLNQSTSERFYGIRDYNVFDQLDQVALDAISADPVRDADPALVDVTNDATPLLPAGALGWKLSLPGEKVLSESRTFAGTVIFTSFEPGASPLPCEQGQGINRVYQVSIFDGSPVTNLDGIGDAENLSTTDRARVLAQTGIAPTPTFLFPSPEAAATEQTCEGEQCSCEGDDCGIPPPRCLIGLEACDVDFGNPPVRTFWTQKDTEAP